MGKPRGDKSKTGLANRKIDPRLRLLGNCDESVCRVRAETDAALAMTETVRLEAEPVMKAEMAEQEGKPKAKPKKGSMREPVSTAKASVFVSVTDLQDSKLGARFMSGQPTRGAIKTAEVPLNELVDLAERPEVISIEIGDRVRIPPVILGDTLKPSQKPGLQDRQIKAQSRRHYYGRDVLIGIIDVGGIDFAHEDFLTPEGETRIERIWDMGGEHRKPPKGFDYGSEFEKSHLDAALKTAVAIGVSPYAIEPQYYQQPGSHATHVASIAAGNRGLCRRSPIACVMLDLAPDDQDRRRSFYDSVRIAHAVNYLLEVAKELGDGDEPLPISINISLGTNGHAHDGSSAISRWIDNALAVPGRTISVAAGNSGQEAPTYPGDLGYIMGRIHSSGHIKGKGLTKTMDWIVAGDGIADMSENEMEIWYEPQDRFSVKVETPGSQSESIGPVMPGEYIENKQLSDGTFISIYNELYRPANGSNTISIYLTPFLKAPYIGVGAGKWKVSLTGEDVRDGHYHAWIERDDPRPHIRKSGVSYASYPSFFSTASNVDSHSVSSLACGDLVLSVGNYNNKFREVNNSSSQGPSRTGRNKPEILAPGTEILAANGFAPSGQTWISMTGTSMASPYIAGVAGLMMGVEPSLSAAQIQGIIRRTAHPIENSDFTWKDDVGFGLINPDECVDEVFVINARSDITDGREE